MHADRWELIDRARVMVVISAELIERAEASMAVSEKLRLRTEDLAEATEMVRRKYEVLAGRVAALSCIPPLSSCPSPSPSGFPCTEELLAHSGAVSYAK
jgi:hypothetical protein